MTLVLSVLEQGMIYAIMALGIYITYTILDFPDLTVDGSFPLGAALSAVLITKGVNPILTLLVTFAAGAFAGMLTGIIHVKLKVRDLLSGIIMMTALYTVNLRIAGRANLPIYNMTTLFDNDFVRNIFKGGLAQFSNVIIILVITLVMKFLLDWYMSTKSGYLLRAVGDNETIVTSMGVDKGITKIIGLAIANGLGVSFLYEAVVGQDAQFGHFCCPPLTGSHELNVVYLKNTPAARYAHAFLSSHP